jgi:hypothetical protein
MITMVTETYWWWAECDKHILNTYICWSYYVNSIILLTYGYRTYWDKQSILAIKYTDLFGWYELYKGTLMWDITNNKIKWHALFTKHC